MKIDVRWLKVFGEFTAKHFPDTAKKYATKIMHNSKNIDSWPLKTTAAYVWRCFRGKKSIVSAGILRSLEYLGDDDLADLQSELG